MRKPELELIKERIKEATGQQYVTDKTALMFQSMDNGLTDRGALELHTGNLKPAKKTLQDLRAKYAKYSLVSPRMVKAAYKQKARILQGEPREIITGYEKDEHGNALKDKPITTLEYPSDALINAVADSVYDRLQPKKSVMETTHNHEHSGSINFEHYANKVIAQDIVIEGESEAVVPGEQGDYVAISEG